MYQYNSNGQKIQMDNQPKMPVKAKENYKDSGSNSSSNKTAWIWIGVIMAVVIVLIIGFIMLRGRSGSSTASMGMKRSHMGAQRWGFRFY